MGTTNLEGKRPVKFIRLVAFWWTSTLRTLCSKNIPGSSSDAYIYIYCTLAPNKNIENYYDVVVKGYYIFGLLLKK